MEERSAGRRGGDSGGRAVLPFLLGTLLLVSSAGPLRAQALEPDLVREIEARCRALLGRAPVPGLAVAIATADGPVYAAGFGVADRESGRPVTSETLFQIGSASMPFTGTLLGILRERGLLSLGDPIERHLPPDVRPPTSSDGLGITLHDLATHTSGLPPQPPTLRRAHDDAPVLAFTHFELYRSLERARLDFRPGERFQYSSFGYALLGHLLERASGVPYETLLEEEVFAPLGMESSTVTLWPESLDRLAVPYYPTGTGEPVRYTPWDAEALAPAAGIASTVEDLARFAGFHLAAHAGGRAGAQAGDGGSGRPAGTVLSPEGRRRLHEPAWPVSAGTAYGLGWVVGDLDGVGRRVGHGGQIDGFTSHLALAPDAGFAVILLANAGDAPLTELGDWLLRRLAERSAAASP